MGKKQRKHFRVFEFASGAAYIVDLGATLGPSVNLYENPWEADARALAADWKAVGLDLLAAAKEHEQHDK